MIAYPRSEEATEFAGMGDFAAHRVSLTNRRTALARPVQQMVYPLGLDQLSGNRSGEVSGR